MRFVITADLHYQPSFRPAYLDFARWVAEQQPDCFILAGDVGHPLRLFQRGLELFAELTCPRLALAGNHDLYRGEHGSQALWEWALPQAARAAGFRWLDDESFVAHGIGVCGTLGWYDYSSQARHLALSDGEYRALKPLVNHDADYINWPWSDRAMARYLHRSFARRLAKLEADRGVHQIVVVTHMPIFRPAVPDYPRSEFWSLLQAYLGNFTLGELVAKHPKVTHVISGHIHRAGEWTVASPHGPIDFRLVGSDKGAPSAVVLDL